MSYYVIREVISSAASASIHTLAQRVENRTEVVRDVFRIAPDIESERDRALADQLAASLTDPPDGYTVLSGMGRIMDRQPDRLLEDAMIAATARVHRLIVAASLSLKRLQVLLRSIVCGHSLDRYRFMARAAWIGIGRDCTEVTITILY